MKKLLSLVLALVMVLSMAAVSTASAGEITDLHTYETSGRDLENWNILNTEQAISLNVLVNLQTSLLANDAKGALVANAAYNWETDEQSKVWTFYITEGIKWVDKDGNEKADVTAQDWVTAMEWVLNFSKNNAANTSMPISMIAGAGDYYEYTKTMAQTYQRITEAGVTVPDELKPYLDPSCFDTTVFSEMVGVEAIDDYTLQYTCVDSVPYFATLCTSAALYPLSAAMVEELGVAGVQSMTWENMWYSGPYLIETFIQDNEKVLVQNPLWFRADTDKRFESVNIKIVESTDTAFTLFQTGELDHVSLTEANLTTIYNNPSNEFYNNLVEARPTKYSYQIHFAWDKKNEDGTSDVNWNTAVANEAFRLSWYYGLDLTSYLARTNAINPQSCQNYAYTANAVGVTSDGRDYTSLVMEKLGLEYDSEGYNRYDPEKAAAYKAQAIEELTAKGVTFPVEIDYYISGSSQTAKDTADVLTQMFSDCLGDDYVKLVTKTYVSSQIQEVRNPQLASIYLNGWGADFGDPENFLGQETYGEDSAYYSMYYSLINNATDPDLIATYQEFTEKVNTARGYLTDLDARYNAYAEAEAYFIEHALAIPLSYEVSWELTCINDFTKPNAAYGIFTYYYVNWETNDDIYTSAEWAELKDAQ